MNYKAPDNSLHFLDDDSFVNLLPAGSVPITDEEVEVLRPKPPELTAKDLLAKLDAENALTQRNLREFIQLTTEAIKMATNNAVDLSQVPGVAKVYQVENEAVRLRAQL